MASPDVLADPDMRKIVEEGQVASDRPGRLFARDQDGGAVAATIDAEATASVL